MRDDAAQGGVIPPDLQIDPTAAATAASSITAGSYTKTIRMTPVVGKTYKFWFTYLYEDSETKKISESKNSPIFTTSFDIPNETKPVLNLTLTAGFKSYGVKFDIDPTSVQTDIIIYESLTGTFTGEEYIVYVGTSTNVSINTSNFAPRWVKVTTRDNWLDANRSSVIAGPVTPKNADPDTSTAPAAPTGVSVSGSIDPDDKSGFSIQLDASWTASSDTNVGGYVIRWTTQNPVTTQNPIWEYGQVDGRTTTKFSVTGAIPNTLYYYQVTAKSPYNAISWASPQSGTVGPIVDPNAPTDAFAQLRSILSIGGKTADLFKIGTGIAQSINTSITITPSQTAGTYSGIILNKSTTNYGHNYWLNTGQFRVGSATNFLYWDGSDLYTTGKINATGGSFTGDVQLNGGSLYAGALPNTGARVRLNSAGVFAYDTNNVQTVAITAADGKIDARQGYIGGWTINATSQQSGTISRNNTIFDSNGNITVGDTTGTLASIVRLSATDATYRLWVGSQTASNAKFRVATDGTLYATGAVFGTGTTVAGYATTAALGNYATTASLATTNTNVTTAQTAADLAKTNAATAKTAADAAKAIADAALPSTSFDRAAIVSKINNSTNTTTIEGGVIKTGTLSADAVVADFISAFSINADKITAGTIGASVAITTPTITVGTDANSYYFKTKSIRTGTSIEALAVNAINMMSAGSAGTLSNWYPYYNDDASLGFVSSPYNLRWRNIFLINSPNVSSDNRYKNNIQVSDLGLDFIKKLNPRKYKLNSRSVKPVVDENGNQILHENSDKPVTEPNLNDPGVRNHYGFIAQEVKEVLDQLGIYDSAAFWTLADKDDSESSQALVYEQFISPLTKAIQELSNMVESLQQEINTLKGI
jgi:hypothetical protein